ncbi:bacteriocin fulvocin C-related protein [Nonomuraea sp. NPDC050451]|uniref:bacteriocin fulvocin C-related protein n=1 Tax=Nonomuraea sp. NPDC050451 TaxID=3364364 RepID=UPI0037996C50
MDTISLSHDDVKIWCKKALGRDCPWRPLLVEVSPNGIRLWTGLPLMFVLCRRIGPRGAMRLLQALSRLDSANADAQTPVGPISSMTSLLKLSRRLLRKKGADVTPEVVEMRAWLDENKDVLPRTYDDIVAHPVAYRRMIYSQLSVEEKAALMRDRLAHYVHEHPGLSAQQSTAISTARAIFGDPSLVANPRDVQVRAQLDRARHAVTNAFGEDEAMVILTMFGPPD